MREWALAGFWFVETATHDDGDVVSPRGTIHSQSGLCRRQEQVRGSEPVDRRGEGNNQNGGRALMPVARVGRHDDDRAPAFARRIRVDIRPPDFPTLGKALSRNRCRRSFFASCDSANRLQAVCSAVSSSLRES